MKCKLATIIIFLLARVTQADFTGFPLTSQTNAYTWESARTNWNPVGQIYSAVVERCHATGVATPTNIVTYSCYAGQSNAIITTNIVTYTNSVAYTNVATFTNLVTWYTNVTKTNCMSAFTFTVGANTYTGHPFLTAGFITSLDNKIKEVTPLTAITNLSYGDLYQTYFSMTNTSGEHPTNLPTHNFASLCKLTGVGYYTNLYTNAWGNPTSGVAWFTFEPATTQNITLAEYRDIRGTNMFHDIGKIDTNYYEAVCPVVRYYSNGTSALSPQSLIIYGSIFSNEYPQVTYAVAETVTVASAWTQTTKLWYDITNFSLSTNHLPNTGDVLAVIYTNCFVLYKDSVGRLNAKDLDERYKLLKEQVWTIEDGYSGLVNVYWYYKPSEWHLTNDALDEVGWDANREKLSNSIASDGNWKAYSGAPPLEIFYNFVWYAYVFDYPAYKWWMSAQRADLPDGDPMQRGSWVVNKSPDVTNYNRAVSSYVAMTNIAYEGDYPTLFYDFTGRMPYPGFYYLYETLTNKDVSSITSSVLKVNSSIGLPVDIPAGDGMPSQGIPLTDPVKYLFRWDVTDGFKYK